MKKFKEMKNKQILETSGYSAGSLSIRSNSQNKGIYGSQPRPNIKGQKNY